MTFLLDTDVISEAGRVKPNGRVASWLVQNEQSSYLSVIGLGELVSGAARLAVTDPVRAQRLVAWREEVSARLADRILGVDELVANRWGQLTARLHQHPITATDSLIAATALVHDLVVATRNVRHFERTGVRLVNPFEA